MHTEQNDQAPEPGSSKRYRNFYSALQLATQSAASKWTLVGIFLNPVLFLFFSYLSP